MTSKRQETPFGLSTLGINGGAQSAHRLLIETSGSRLHELQTA